MAKMDIGTSLPSALIQALEEGASFRINHLFLLTVNKEWRIPLRVIEDLHLLYVRGGRGEYRVNGERIPLECGRVILVGPGVEHEALQDLEDPPQIIAVRFDLTATGRGSPLRYSLPPFTLNRLTTPGSVLEHLFNLANDFHLAREAAAAGSALHCILKRLEGMSEREWIDQRLEPAYRKICAEPEERPRLNELAKAAGMSARHFVRLFQSHYGRSPHQLWTALRLNRARSLLEESSLELKMISARLGYPDVYCFARQFKAHFGSPPGRLRAHRGERG